MKPEFMAFEDAVLEIRKECRQYAMLYFHFCKALVDEFGLEKAKEIVTKAVFGISVDRTNKLREKAKELGLDFTVDSFNKVTDLPTMAWVKELGRNHCPYAECWVQYYDEYPWFRELAPLYCNVIDTTNIENFTCDLSHKLVKNVLEGADTCDRIYFESEIVKNGGLTYGTKK